MKIARTIELHIGADLWPAITLARIKIFWSDKKQLVGSLPSFQKHHKTYFDGRSYRDPPAPLKWLIDEGNCEFEFNFTITQARTEIRSQDIVINEDKTNQTALHTSWLIEWVYVLTLFTTLHYILRHILWRLLKLQLMNVFFITLFYFICSLAKSGGTLWKRTRTHSKTEIITGVGLAALTNLACPSNCHFKGCKVYKDCKS